MIGTIVAVIALCNRLNDGETLSLISEELSLIST